jgi:peptidoglycan/xylan/chitin deacetylase (PgdA/CDA1 family)
MISQTGNILHCKTIAILAFHKIGGPSPGGWKSWFYIPEETFTGHLKFLRDNNWDVVSVSTFLQGLTEPDALHDRTALITFDDGYRSVREVALPALRRFGYPAVLFVPTAYIGQHNMFDDGIEPREDICDWNDLRDLMSHGVAVQSHGISHRRFSEISLDEQKEELIGSKSILENNLGKPVEFMAFPYGDDGKNKEQTKRCLRETGYQAACLYGGDSFVLHEANPYCLSRIAMGPDTNLEEVLGVNATRVKR